MDKESATVTSGFILHRDFSTIFYSSGAPGRSKHTGSSAHYKLAGLGSSNDRIGIILSSIFM